jgi:hypothetical protein
MGLRLSVALSLVALLALAGLQYHWIGQIAVAERQRLQRGVAEASGDLAEDFSSELRQLAGIFEPRFSPVPPIPFQSRRDITTGRRALRIPVFSSLFTSFVPRRMSASRPATETFVPDSWPDVWRHQQISERARLRSPRSRADSPCMPLNRGLSEGRGGGRGPNEVPPATAGKRGRPERDQTKTHGSWSRSIARWS